MLTLRLTIVASVVLVALTLMLSIIWALQRALIYFPSSDVPAPADLGLSAVETVTFDTTDGLRLHGWFFGVIAASSSPRVTVLVFNGNAGNRAHRALFAQALLRHGLQVLLFDYRGFGGNPGSPTEQGLTRDSRAARAYLLSRPDVDAARMVYFGESLGTAVAVDLAAQHAPAALVLRSPFTSLADVGGHHYRVLPVRLLLRDRFSAIDRIPQVRAPLLVIAGERDRIVPLQFSRQLYEAASSPKTLLVVAGADHNDEALFSGDEMMQAILQLVAPLRVS